MFVVASERTAASNGNGETVTPCAVTEHTANAAKGNAKLAASLFMREIISFRREPPQLRLTGEPFAFRHARMPRRPTLRSPKRREAAHLTRTHSRSPPTRPELTSGNRCPFPCPIAAFAVVRQLDSETAFEVHTCANPFADPARIRATAEDYRNGKRNYHLHELPPLPHRSDP